MKDNVIPGTRWEFDEYVTDCFEDMLERSIPQYSVMRKSVSKLSNAIVSSNKNTDINILDIGCSDGLMIKSLKENIDCLNKNITYTGIDVSEPMLKKAKHRFLDEILNRTVQIYNCDLRTDFPSGNYDLITSCLSIQFTPIEYRQHIIQNVYNSLNQSNGVFIMVEKVLGNTDSLNRLFIDTYYDMKRENGYSDEQIERKRLSLEGVLVPVTNSWNIELLKQAGFRQVDVFWRWMNFVGYIAIK